MMDNRTALKRLNDAVGKRRCVEIEDLSDARIQIEGFEACREVEEDLIPNADYNATGIPRLLFMLVDRAITPKTRETIWKYFVAENDARRKKMILEYAKEIAQIHKRAQKLMDLQEALSA